MKLPWRWIAVGAVAYLIFLVATAPATLLTRRLASQGVVIAEASGSVWSGRAAAIQYRGFTLGATQWRINAAALLLGRLTLEFKSKRDDGFVNATVSARLSGKLHISDLRAALPLSAIGSMSSGMVRGWQGNLQAQVAELVLVQGWPVYLRGTIDATELVGPASQPASIGGYSVSFDGSDANGTAGELQGQLSSRDNAPLDVAGFLRLQPNRQYVIDAQVGTRTNAPEQIRKALEYLGPPDAQGRRPLSVSGSL
ncbi:MAG: type II secretion system protein N [Candidatus Obscuribacterales bacterium]|nr:type II secretion system protein N [Steroidobacteraceae bacterium]